MKNVQVHRSALYTPGTNPTVMPKAARSEADVLIFDLVDAVAPESKADARRHVVHAFSEPAVRESSVIVRVNGLNRHGARKTSLPLQGPALRGYRYLRSTRSLAGAACRAVVPDRNTLGYRICVLTNK
jgi:citrate lyase beta subunit